MGDKPLEGPELERAAAALLRKRGYIVLPVDEAELREATASSGDFKASARSPAERVAYGRLLRATAVFGRLADWVEASPTTLRTELRAGIFPIFLHLFVALMEADETLEARSLLEDHGDVFVCLGANGRHSPSTIRFLDRLHTLRTPSDLQGEELYENFRRDRRTTVAMSQLGRELLLSRLLSLEMVVLADIFQFCVTVVEPAQLPPGSGPALEASLSDMRVVNSSMVWCNVDVNDPPAAYGQLEPGKTQSQQANTTPTSSENVAQRCGMPLPLPRSVMRAKASARFAEAASQRVPVSSSRLPSIATYVVDGLGDGMDDINCVAVSSCGRFCAAGARGARLWDLQGSNSKGIAHTAFNGNSNLEVAGVLRARHGSSSSFLGHRGRVLSLAFSLDSDLLLTAAQDGTMRLWNTTHQSAWATYVHHQDPVWSVDWCPVGNYFVSSGPDGEGLLWSVERGSPLRSFAPIGGSCSLGAPGSDVEVVRAHPSAKYAALANEQSVVLWDLAAATPARIFLSQSSSTALGFSADGKSLAVGCADGRIEIWDIGAACRTCEFPRAHRDSVLAVDFSWPSPSEESPLLFSGGSDGLVQLHHPMPRAEDAMPQQRSAPLLQATNTCPAQPVVAGRFTPANLLLVAGVASPAPSWQHAPAIAGAIAPVHQGDLGI